MGKFILAVYRKRWQKPWIMPFFSKERERKKKKEVVLPINYMHKLNIYLSQEGGELVRSSSSVDDDIWFFTLVCIPSSCMLDELRCSGYLD